MTAPDMLGIAPCYACKQPFAFDPDRVTSVSIDPVTGLPPDLGGDPGRARREPLCPRCCRIANVERAARGLALLDETDTATPRPE
jgi:hypothetical protein